VLDRYLRELALQDMRRRVAGCFVALNAGAKFCAVVRKAHELSLITVQDRGRHGQRNLPNVVRIIAPEWLAWLQLATGKGGSS
jgi:hypothetical protein